jgi:hypothetical protein
VVVERAQGTSVGERRNARDEQPDDQQQIRHPAALL